MTNMVEKILNTARKAKRSKKRILFGVCRGIANYYKIRPIIVRFLFVLFLVGHFIMAIFVYFFLAFSMREEKWLKKLVRWSKKLIEKLRKEKRQEIICGFGLSIKVWLESSEKNR